jgi:uncharacterized peroxidase-related enzyme
MERIPALPLEKASGKSKELYEAINKKLGMIPNMMKVMGNSPAVLNGYWSFSNALGQSSIGAKMAELIALAVSGRNNCLYCTTAHTFIAANIYGIDPDTIYKARMGKSDNKKVQAVLAFVVQLIENGGKVSDDYIDALKNEGFDTGAITEIIAHTALITLTNFINNVSKVEVDFPFI